MRRGRRHDYFTSCLPWPQKGTALRVPMASPSVISNGQIPTYNQPNGGLTNLGMVYHASDDRLSLGTGTTVNGNVTVGNQSGLSAIGGTINELRMAEAIQTPS